MFSDLLLNCLFSHSAVQSFIGSSLLLAFASTYPYYDGACEMLQEQNNTSFFTCCFFYSSLFFPLRIWDGLKTKFYLHKYTWFVKKPNWLVKHVCAVVIVVPEPKVDFMSTLRPPRFRKISIRTNQIYDVLSSWVHRLVSISNWMPSFLDQEKHVKENTETPQLSKILWG